jgi:1-acyl-sn-glycerol-3-phosphate acyltransferase
MDQWYKDLSGQIEGNKHIISDYFDLDFTKEIVDKVITCLEKTYFRPRFIGFDKYPKRNNPDVPLIFSSNHSGMAFPWDGIVLASAVYEMFDYGPKSFRPLASPMLSESVLMNPYLYSNLWKLVGSVDASFLNFETMMHQNDHNVLIYPEGIGGIGKGFNHRYHLQRFSSSFITLSIKYQTDIIPILTVNGEFINPLAYKSAWINKLVNKIGVPYLPLGPVSALMPFQPWIFYSALPAKLTYILGERISPHTMTDKSIDEISYEEIVDIKEKVRTEMQRQLSEAVLVYGNSPYEMKEFISLNLKHIRKFPYYFPFGWPLLFSEFQRAWKKRQGKKVHLKLGFLSSLRIMFTQPFNIWYFIPLIGWIPILMKGITIRKKNRNT